MFSVKVFFVVMEDGENLENSENQENEVTEEKENEQPIVAEAEVKDDHECERKLQEAEEKIAIYENELKNSKTHIDQFQQQKVNSDKEIQLVSVIQKFHIFNTNPFPFS